MGEEKINRWFQSNDRKQIIDELNEIEILQNSLQRTLHEWERHGKTVDEWKYQYGEYWERLFIRREFLEMVIQRGDAGEYVSRYFENAASHNVNSTDKQNNEIELSESKNLWKKKSKGGRPSEVKHDILDNKVRYHLRNNNSKIINNGRINKAELARLSAEGYNKNIDKNDEKINAEYVRNYFYRDRCPSDIKDKIK